MEIAIPPPAIPRVLLLASLPLAHLYFLFPDRGQLYQPAKQEGQPHPHPQPFSPLTLAVESQSRGDSIGPWKAWGSGRKQTRVGILALPFPAVWPWRWDSPSLSLFPGSKMWIRTFHRNRWGNMNTHRPSWDFPGLMGWSPSDLSLFCLEEHPCDSHKETSPG